MHTPTHAVVNLARVSVWLLVLAVSIWRRWTLATAFAATLLLHGALDLLLHHGDALRQLWPISDYRFISPVSYWDVQFHAAWVRPIELAMLLISSWIVWRRHPSPWLRASLVVTNVSMAAALVTGRLFWSL